MMISGVFFVILLLQSYNYAKGIDLVGADQEHTSYNIYAQYERLK